MRTFFVAIFTFLITSCSDDDNCSYLEIDIQYNDSINNCSNLSFDMVEPLDAYVIMDENIFNNIITTDCPININFQEFDLIIGKSLYPPSDYTLRKTCEESNYILSIKSLVGSNADGQAFNFYILVRKGILEETDLINVDYLLISG